MITRRRFLGAGGSVLAGVTLGPVLATRSARAADLSASPTRAVSLEHLHTGERLAVVYAEGGEYLPDALAEVDHLLRDFRTGEVQPIDPRLLDILWTLGRCDDRAARCRTFRVISGFRSVETNEMLRATTSGVASTSWHLVGRAVDVRCSERSTRELRDAGIALGAGGVGYYPSSDFVHLDTGRVRCWG